MVLYLYFILLEALGPCDDERKGINATNKINKQLLEVEAIFRTRMCASRSLISQDTLSLSFSEDRRGRRHRPLSRSPPFWSGGENPVLIKDWILLPSWT